MPAAMRSAGSPSIAVYEQGRPRSPPPRPSDSSEQDEDQQDDNDGTENAGGAVSPVPAMSPAGQRADQEEDQYDQQNRPEHLILHDCGGYETVGEQSCSAIYSAKLRNRFGSMNRAAPV